MNNQDMFEYTLEEQEEDRILIKKTKELMESMGIDMNANNIPSHLQELNKAVENEDVNCLRVALDNLISSSSINEPFNQHKERAIHIACEYGSLPCVQLLLESGAKLQVKNAMGETPLHIASDIGDTDLVRLLIDHGTNQNTIQRMLRSINNEGSTSLHEATNGGDENIDVVRLLLAAGASTKTTNFNRKKPWQLANPNTEIRSLLRENNK